MFLDNFKNENCGYDFQDVTKLVLESWFDGFR